MNHIDRLYFLLLFIHFPLALFGQNDPLPSWNEGSAKQQILEFVREATNSESKEYIPPEDRIATFDQDGTLWVEHPLYTQATFTLERVMALAPQHPEWKTKEPFRAVLSEDSQAIAKLTEQEWQLMTAITSSGMSTADFTDIVAKWIKTAKHPRFHRLYTELAYQPMLEVINFLRAHSFKTYIVTGSGQEFVRVYSQAIYGIPSEQVIGSSIATSYEYQSGQPMLMRMPKVFFIDNHEGKAIGINLFIGKRPHAAFGNSDGDREMLEWTQNGDRKRLMMLVHHDDPIREYAYGPAGGMPNTDVGNFSEELMTEAKMRAWIIISMKDDWKHIFSFPK